MLCLIIFLFLSGYFMIQRTKTELPNKQPRGSTCTRYRTPPSTDPDLISGLRAALAPVDPSLQVCAGGLCHEHAEGDHRACRLPEMNASTLLLPSVRGWQELMFEWSSFYTLRWDPPRQVPHMASQSTSKAGLQLPTVETCLVTHYWSFWGFSHLPDKLRTQTSMSLWGEVNLRKYLIP